MNNKHSEAVSSLNNINLIKLKTIYNVNYFVLNFLFLEISFFLPKNVKSSISVKHKRNFCISKSNKFQKIN